MNDPVRPPVPFGSLRHLLARLRFPWFPRRPDPKQQEPRPTADEIAAERLRDQVDVIRRAFGEDQVAVAARDGGWREEDPEVHYLYRPGHVLIREDDLPRLEEFLGSDNREMFDGELLARETPTRGLALVQLPSRRDEQDVLATIEEFERSVRREEGTDRLEKPLEDRAIISPDHVVYVTGRGYMCPATEPEMPGRNAHPWPPPTASTGQVADDERIRVSVVDTGLWTKALGSPKSPWLDPNDVMPADKPDDEEIVDPQDIHPYAGHGTFVAGVISCLAPDTRIEVEGVLTKGGAVYESEICAQLDQALGDPDDPHLISISAGSHTRGNYAMISFEMLAENHGLGNGDRTLVIAAAGNDSSTDPFWPAAFPWVTAVGSVDPDGKISDFSNRGPWVDVYARGRDLINAFPDGAYTCYEAPNKGQVRQFDGLARWSGTSFATPIVTGLIAARMRATGEDVRTARDAVLATANPAAPVKVVGPLT
jgi:hypothetical protein